MRSRSQQQRRDWQLKYSARVQRRTRRPLLRGWGRCLEVSWSCLAESWSCLAESWSYPEGLHLRRCSGPPSLLPLHLHLHRLQPFLQSLVLSLPLVMKRRQSSGRGGEQ